jgi:transporter family protein
MMWITLAFLSALFNGCYDISKKTAVNNNAILPVLFFSAFFSILLLLPAALMSGIHPERTENTLFHIPQMSAQAHTYILVRATLILLAWLTGYSALKHLPITIVGPINATRPVITLVSAIALFRENLNLYQWIGVLITITSLLLLSLSGKREGLNFARNRWITLAFTGALAGSISELFEKFLMQRISFMAVLLWTSVYQSLLIGIILLVVLLLKPGMKFNFTFRWSIPLITLFLMLTDFAYLNALSCTGSMISMISLIRRSSILVSFAGGVIYFREKNLKAKIIDLLLIVTGMIFLYLGCMTVPP